LVNVVLFLVVFKVASSYSNLFAIAGFSQGYIYVYLASFLPDASLLAAPINICLALPTPLSRLIQTARKPYMVAIRLFSK
jgi:hypothetical protein